MGRFCKPYDTKALFPEHPIKEKISKVKFFLPVAKLPKYRSLLEETRYETVILVQVLSSINKLTESSLLCPFLPPLTE